MKIVINGCYGGFGVSQAVVKELMQMKSDAIESFDPREYYGGNNPNFPQSEWAQKFNRDKIEYYTNDLGGGLLGHKYHDTIWNTNDGMLYRLKNKYDTPGVRTNKDLIKVVKDLGKAANGPHASLRIVDIPDDVDWEIDEYDGVETIHEVHRSWG